MTTSFSPSPLRPNENKLAQYVDLLRVKHDATFVHEMIAVDDVRCAIAALIEMEVTAGRIRCQLAALVKQPAE